MLVLKTVSTLWVFDVFNTYPEFLHSTDLIRFTIEAMILLVGHCGLCGGCQTPSMYASGTTFEN